MLGAVEAPKSASIDDYVEDPYVGDLAGLCYVVSEQGGDVGR
jgi:hypothetical protein